MSHFILLRQRIKVIETIKKTTGAMRLISMSLHSRLRNQKSSLEAYAHEIRRIKETVVQEAIGSKIPEVEQTSNAPVRLVLLIGSQKGLCGAFNENLFRFFEKEYTLTGTEQIVTVGKYATEYIKKQGIKPLRTFDQFGISNFVAIAEQLKKLFLERSQQARIFSNSAPTFFSQKPKEHSLVSLQASHAELLNYLASLELKSTFLHILHESLLAEQAARFVSMDLAYRNADEVLNQTRLDYNKTRQAYVTRELIELSGGMVAQE